MNSSLSFLLAAAYDPRSWVLAKGKNPKRSNDSQGLISRHSFGGARNLTGQNRDDIHDKPKETCTSKSVNIPHNADSFRTDLHLDPKADFVPVRKNLANPPSNVSNRGGELLRGGGPWKFGRLRMNNANYAWNQHFLHSLRPWA